MQLPQWLGDPETWSWSFSQDFPEAFASQLSHSVTVNFRLRLDDAYKASSTEQVS